MERSEEKPWTRPKGPTRKSGARPPTEDEQADAAHMAERMWELIERLQTIGFSEQEAVIFIAEVAMEESKKYPGVPTWATKGGAVRAIRRMREGAAILDWGYDIFQIVVPLIEEDIE